MLNIIDDYKKNIHKSRLDWDEYFMSIALLASLRSPCNRLKVGTVLVKNNRIIAMGYNGYCAGAPHESIIVDNHEQAIIHSEINAISDCAKRGVSLDNSIAYITHYPCINCFKTLASCGIKTIYYYEDYNNDPIVEVLVENTGIQVVNKKSLDK